MTTTETIRADQLQVGDVVTALPRDGQTHPLTVGRAQIGNVYPDMGSPGRDGRYVWIVWNYASRKCDYGCDDQPLDCSHYGHAGGGSGRLTVDQQVERYVR